MLIFSVPIHAQSNGKVIIQDIIISGNQKTNPKIISREIDLKSGDTLFTDQIEKKLLWIQNRVFNTGLFIEVETNLDTLTNKKVNLHVKVKERWYTYIFPLVELADRNFNEWWEQRNHDLNRINYGFWFVQKNVRGRNETLKIKLQGGFTGKLEASYSIPYIQSNQTAGLTLGISYIYSRSAAANLYNNQLFYLEGNQSVIRRFTTGAEYQYRGKYYTFQKLRVLYQQQWIADTIRNFNPEYLGSGKNNRQYFSLGYSISIDRRDIQFYARNGYFISFYFEKDGLGIWNDLNIGIVKSEIGAFLPLGHKFYFATGVSTKLYLPRKQAFYDYRGLGYDNHFVRGYELYVINGQLSSVWRNSFKLLLYQKTRDASWLKWKQFNKIPLSIFPTLNFDLGYVYEEKSMEGNQSLSNILLPGGGIGLDFVTFYDLVFRTEYSFNRLGQHGFYLHFMAAIGGKKFL